MQDGEEEDLFSACLREERSHETQVAVASRRLLLGSGIDDLALPASRALLPHVEVLAFTAMGCARDRCNADLDPLVDVRTG